MRIKAIGGEVEDASWAVGNRDGITCFRRRCPQLIRDALEARSVHEQTERFATLALRTTKATSI
jgi:hypothetical protein